MRISDWSSDVCSSDLLEITDTFGSVPRAEAVKWHWFENVPARDSAERHQVPQLWFLRSEEHTSELQSLMRSSYAVFCLKKTHHTHANELRYTSQTILVQRNPRRRTRILLHPDQ